MTAAAVERGQTGEAVRDLQRRLTAVGHDCSADEPGEFGPATEAAVAAFQDHRSLVVDGLWFDAGREHGILGKQTAGAVSEFQRNVGLAPDGFCGWTTVAALRRVGGLAAGSVASVREREMLRRGPHGLGGKRVFLTAAPGFEALGDAVCRGLAEAGAGALLDSAGSDDSTTAIAANEFGAALFLALRARAGSDCLCSYFSTGT